MSKYTTDTLLTETLKIFDEIVPSQGGTSSYYDDDIREFVNDALKRYVNEYISILPLNAVDGLLSNKKIKTDDTNYADIEYNGGSWKTEDILRVFSIKMDCWSHPLSENMIIDGSHPLRLLQSSKYTCGGKSKPVASIEFDENGNKVIAFWCKPNEKGTLSYIPLFKGTETTVGTTITTTSALEDFLDKCKENVVLPYIYFVLSYIFNTTQEIELSTNAMNKAKELLSIQTINPTLPAGEDNSD